MSITLTPQTESRLRAQAERTGQDVNAFAEALLSDALAASPWDDADTLTEDQIAEIRAGIRRGLAAEEEGRERPVAEYAADVQKRRAARRAETVPHG